LVLNLYLQIIFIGKPYCATVSMMHHEEEKEAPRQRSPQKAIHNFAPA
jgi:hypothetical protein